MISGPKEDRKSLGTRLAQFFADRSGHYGTITALMMAPMLAMASSSIDLVRLLSAREQLQQAADAAALDAVAAQNWGRYLKPGASAPDLNRAAKKKIEANFRAQLKGPDVAGMKITVVPAVSMVGRQLQSTLTYTAEMPTTFMKVIGIPVMHLEGTAHATSMTPRYTNITFLVDNSPSMGIGATYDAMDALRASSPKNEQCEFACHTAEMPDTYLKARALGIPVRIDTVKQALHSLADAMEATRFAPRQYTTTLYTLGSDAITHKKKYITRIGAASTGLDSFHENIDRVELMYMNTQAYNWRINTDLPNALTEVAKLLPSPGDAASPEKADQLLILISDGLSNSIRPDCTITPYGDPTSVHCQEPVDPKKCAILKDRGIRIATLYTTFLPLPLDQWYRITIRPFQNLIPVGMRDCASPGLFFEVGFNQSMDDAIEALFTQAVNTPRLID